ncbi:glycosyltransferase family 4 protein [Flavivirga rizhaonensis]|uniref:Glycosyltransferase family 4 protein n=1 Tax=Flavivirga rizhaonensis TaxID=2559571 RepID=A0A4S1DZY9_9FLAO|nr:glycosyltransferase family 4 protein [Flavivirga rizhaonensis]TGV03951.1 glycosyltransferase family 4 protein [Flavivirga rizhaonensis]
MRLVYITDQIYLHGGAERVLSNKVNYLTAFNTVEVYIITSQQDGQKPCYHIDSKVVIKDLDIKYVRTESYFSVSNLRKAPAHYFKLSRLLNKIKPDVVITLSSQFDYYYLPYIHRKSIKIKEFHSSRHYYQEIRQHGSNSFLKKIIYKLNDFTEKKYSFNAILTDDEKKYFKSDNTVVIPNALTRFPDDSSSLKNKKVISAGRIAPVKRFEDLISAWKIVAETNKEWVLEIYGNGEGSYLKDLKKLINEASLQKSIFIKEATNEIEKKMLEASFYVMTSETECFPMVLLEAMSVGLPIISFDCPNGPKNIITNHSDGLLIENKNINALAEAILLMMNNKSLREKFGKNAKLSVKKYDKEIIMKKWLELFKYNQS